MTGNTKPKPTIGKTLLRWTGLEIRELMLSALALIIIFTAVASAVHVIEKRYKQGVGNSLNTLLHSTELSLNIWARDKKFEALDFARNEQVVADVETLLRASARQQVLLSSPAQKSLRRLYYKFRKDSQLRGFFIINPANVSLASSRDGNVGTRNLLLSQPDVLKKLWQGETVISRVRFSDLPLPEQTGADIGTRDMTLFVGAPIREASGKVIALLTLRIDPNTTLFRMLQNAREGDTGEAFIFDRHGLMLSPSRFTHQLASLGLIEPGEASALHIRLQDNGSITKPVGKTASQPDDPLTRMVESARHFQAGSDLQGYRSYRGVPVVGAWLWCMGLDVGLAVEQDKAEAFSAFRLMRNMIYGTGLISIFALLFVALSFGRGRRQLRETQTRLSAVVEHAVDGIIVIDHHGCIESVNPAVELIFGYPNSALIGQNISRLMPAPYRDEHDGYLRRYLSTGEARIIGIGREVQACRADGSTFPIDLSVSRLEMDSGLHFAGLIRDVSERKDAEKNLLKAKEEAEAANRAKSVFLAMMSHEIRTPLNGVVGTIDLLAHSSLDNSQREMVRTAKDSSLALMTIIDDILDFSKIEAGRLELEQVPMLLGNLVEGVAETLHPQANRKNVDLLVYSDPAIPELLGDPLRLRQIVLNLVSNAIKFTGDRPGHVALVKIDVELVELLAKQAKIRISVQDTGIGIAPDAMQRLFQPFRQAEDSTTRRFGGTGLGLAISRRLASMMGGKIGVESVEGEGSVFTVSLSLDLVPSYEPSSKDELHGLRLLLVKGDPHAVPILEGYLRNAGAQVLSVGADEAVRRFSEVRSGASDMILVIDAEGDEATFNGLHEMLRKQVGDAALRFLLVNRGRRRHIRPYGEDGMTIDLNAMRRSTLINAVAVLAGLKSLETDSQRLTIKSGVVPPSKEAAAAAGRLILLAEDNEINQYVIQQQLANLGYLAEIASDGKQALAMWRKGSYALLLTDCHMPEMDGYDLAGAIRAEEGSDRHIPIIAITADAMKDTASLCLDAGMDDYLTKPMQLEQLHLTLDKWMPHPSPQTENAASNQVGMQIPDEAAGTQPVKTEAIDPDVLSATLGMDDAETLARFYGDFQYTGSEVASQIVAAHRDGEDDRISKLAHKLKSSSRTVGANALADCCLALEAAGKAGDAQELALQMGRFMPLFQQVSEWIDDFVLAHSPDQ